MLREYELEFIETTLITTPLPPVLDYHALSVPAVRYMMHRGSSGCISGVYLSYIILAYNQKIYDTIEYTSNLIYIANFISATVIFVFMVIITVLIELRKIEKSDQILYFF